MSAATDRDEVDATVARIDEARLRRGTPVLEAMSVSVEDFCAYMPTHQYIYVPTRELWPVSSVNARLGTVPTVNSKTKPADWLDSNRPIDQMTWAPGMPMIVTGKLVADGGWFDRPGSNCFNLYRAPAALAGNPAQVKPWTEHLHRVYPDDLDHIVRWLAHRVQRPAEKINHALVLGGGQGIGKDTLLEPAKHAVGPWNFAEVSPSHLLGRFNGFVKSVILRISEARDLGDVHRYGFYDHMKVYTAAPPDVIRCDEKNLREHAVMNVTGVIITSNHKADGIYLPADDRRHYVAWSALSKDDFPAQYWRDLWAWYIAGGIGHVAAYLSQFDLGNFDPKEPPPKTAAWHAIVDANRAPEDAEVADALDRINASRHSSGRSTPVPAITIEDIAVWTDNDQFRGWVREPKNRRQIPHRMEDAGYVPVRNSIAKDGLWTVRGRRQVIYSRRELSLRDQIGAAEARSKEL